ncbi:dipeptide ABC transporter ATP-binding protein [Curtobacterium flaccumfaciens]|uniref:dipeptide ABC transporter ATP-binding protein n=1 Tax=Curtobacterium flaccumfaciens TaxID=2035 RepID=UPI001BDE7B53|nr:ABC transporter ATP-binding protein [Curtobacterium flaccumfaciens]MBT1607247.1 ABC transporter ATP-binding protein [Curtobacterium flaccumfaciens pv. betae]MBT1656766.1 ABC transporter ATP-binding protein [Curtobacterium flaccumfaciens pv. betae]MCS0472540.1 ABC transporter ATP-binding protein [Curtobacterium flaccumfaciens pv. betae]MCS0476118.1 ABC transporter ATP-binding protein [Curtobacterium flaccumfaciens pv. betae]MCS0479280.1 ABC transporter ATP-binding protein [Curtobacterium fla
MTTEPILRTTDLGVSFSTESGTVDAVRGVSLTVAPGETLALVGESGSGKSTVALAAMGLLSGNATASGSAVVAGHQVVGAGEPALRALRGSTVSMVFQEPATALDPLTRVGAQIAEVIRNHRDVSASAAAAAAVDLLRRVGIPDPESRTRSFPFQLSGGQRQRVVIAMAIANAPKLLIADEPTTALDVTVQAEILELLRALAAETGTGVLLVTHNMGVVADFADRVAVMLQGEIVETGGVEDVLLRPEHEYTKRLLAAVPRLDVAGDRPSAPVADTQTETAGRPGAAPVVDLRDVSVTFGRGARAVHALAGIDIAVHAGETVGLVGESGSGKSTAARVALGLIKPTSGTVSLFGQDLRTAKGRDRRALRSGIGVVLQDPVASLDARMSVAECIAEPLAVHRRGMSSADRRRRIDEVLDAVRLPRTLASRAPRELSGGQRQRVSLARALVLEPRLLVADEPTSALDVSVQETVLEVLGELQDDLGFACLFVSHDLAVVQHFAERVVVMRSGVVEEQGTTGTTLLHPTTDYTRRLLAAVPVPDPVLQRQRRTERLASLAAVTA